MGCFLLVMIGAYHISLVVGYTYDREGKGLSEVLLFSHLIPKEGHWDITAQGLTHTIC